MRKKQFLQFACGSLFYTVIQDFSVFVLAATQKHRTPEAQYKTRIHKWTAKTDFYTFVTSIFLLFVILTFKSAPEDVPNTVRNMLEHNIVLQEHINY
jgi:hypothetical protein